MGRSIEIMTRNDIREEVKEAIRKESDWILREMKRLRVRLIELENIFEKSKSRLMFKNE